MFRHFVIGLLMMAGAGVAAFLGLWAYSLSNRSTPEQKLAALEKEVKPKGGEIFQTVLAGRPMVFLMLECSVYIIDASGEEIKKDKVLSPGFYFGLDVCTDQSISAEGEFVKVYLANRAIGAGGGNTSGGNYRSKDGMKWEKKTDKGWRPVDEAQP